MEVGFEEFWKIFPRKVGKLDAQKAYDKAITRTTVDKIRLAAKAYADTCNGKDAQYVAHPATWLNRGSWDDDAMANGKDIAAALGNEKYQRTFTDEYPFARPVSGRPPALNFANIFMAKNHPRYAEMAEKSEAFDTDPREFRHDGKGIWVVRKWLRETSNPR